MLKLTKAIIGTLLLVTTSYASATLIVGHDVYDHGTYTSVDGVDWLDWSITDNMTQADAIAANSGYRGATLIEMEALMNAFFGGGGPLVFINGQNDCQIFSCYENFGLFQTLFGTTKTGGSLASAVGVGTVGAQGSGVNKYAGNTANGIYTAVDFNEDWRGVALVKGNDLVQPNTSVPEPSTLAIFALGMIGLASRRFKKQ